MPEPIQNEVESLQSPTSPPPSYRSSPSPPTLHTPAFVPPQSISSRRPPLPSFFGARAPTYGFPSNIFGQSTTNTASNNTSTSSPTFPAAPAPAPFAFGTGPTTFGFQFSSASLPSASATRSKAPIAPPNLPSTTTPAAIPSFPVSTGAASIQLGSSVLSLPVLAAKTNSWNTNLVAPPELGFAPFAPGKNISSHPATKSKRNETARPSLNTPTTNGATPPNHSEFLFNNVANNNVTFSGSQPFISTSTNTETDKLNEKDRKGKGPAVICNYDDLEADNLALKQEIVLKNLVIGGMQDNHVISTSLQNDIKGMETLLADQAKSLLKKDNDFTKLKGLFRSRIENDKLDVVDLLQKDLETCETRAEGLQEIVSEQLDRIENLQKQVRDLESEDSKKQRTIEECEEQINEYIVEIEAYQEKIGTYEEKDEADREKTSDLEQAIREFEQADEARVKVMAERDSSDFNRLSSDQTREIINLTSERDTANSNYEHLEAKFAEELTKHEETKTRLKNELDEHAETRNEFKHVQEELEEEKKWREQAVHIIASLESSKTTLSGKIEELNSRITHFEARIKTLGQVNEDLQRDGRGLNSQITVKDGAIKELATELTAAQGKATDYDRVVRELEEANIAMEGIKQQIEQAKSDPVNQFPPDPNKFQPIAAQHEDGSVGSKKGKHSPIVQNFADELRSLSDGGYSHDSLFGGEEEEEEEDTDGIEKPSNGRLPNAHLSEEEEGEDEDGDGLDRSSNEGEGVGYKLPAELDSEGADFNAPILDAPQEELTVSPVGAFQETGPRSSQQTLSISALGAIQEFVPASPQQEISVSAVGAVQEIKPRLPYLSLTGTRAIQQTEPIAPLRETLGFSKIQCIQHTEPILPRRELLAISDIQGTQHTEPTSPFTPRYKDAHHGTDDHDFKAPADIPTPPPSPTIVHLPYHVSNHDALSCWLATDTQAIKLGYLGLSGAYRAIGSKRVFSFSWASESGTFGDGGAVEAGAAASIGGVSEEDAQEQDIAGGGEAAEDAVEVLDEDEAKDIEPEETEGATQTPASGEVSSVATADGQIINEEQETEADEQLGSVIASPISTQPTPDRPTFIPRSDSLTPPATPTIRTLTPTSDEIVLSNWKSILIAFFTHLIIYYLITLSILTVLDRDIWLQANERTRSVLSDLLAIRASSNSHGSFGLMAWLPENWVRGVNLAILAVAEVFRYEQKGYSLPG